MKNSTLSDEIKELAAAYVIDELEPEEIAGFEQMMSANLAVRQEVRELQIALGSLALNVPQLAPPTHLRAKTLAALGIVD
jgi:anti-sigma-K factor RskA